MGYFSNGTEGEDYYQRYCSRCVHDKDQDCPIWGAHLLLNYQECNKPDSILHALIPRDGVRNLPCRLFVEEKASGDLFAQEGI